MIYSTQISTLFSWIIIAILMHLSIQDIKHKKVSLMVLLLFNIVMLSTQKILNLEIAIIVISIIIMIKIFCIIYAHKSIIGNGDLLIIFPMICSLPTNDISIFLIISGIGGIIFGKIWSSLLKQSQSPFIPPLSFAYIITYFFPINFLHIFLKFQL